MSVPWTTLRRSSARVSASRSRPSMRVQRPMYMAGRVLRLETAHTLEDPREGQPRALEQELPREQSAVQLPLGEGSRLPVRHAAKLHQDALATLRLGHGLQSVLVKLRRMANRESRTLTQR